MALALLCGLWISGESCWQTGFAQSASKLRLFRILMSRKENENVIRTVGRRYTVCNRWLFRRQTQKDLPKVNLLMAEKLKNSQSLIEALATEDYAKMQKNAEELIRITRRPNGPSTRRQCMKCKRTTSAAPRRR
jgi:hypothetical protein